MSKLLRSVICICTLFGMSACLAVDPARSLNLAGDAPEDRPSSLESVKSDTERQNTVSLLKAAAAAHKLGKVEDAAFLFYAGQIRLRIDEEVFIKAQKPGVLSSEQRKSQISTGQALAAAQMSLGQAINPPIFGDTEGLKRVHEHLRKWQPVIDPGHNPLWEAEPALHGEDLAAVILEKKQDFLEPMFDTVTLMQSPTYFEALQLVRDYNFGTADYRNEPGVEEQYDAARATMKRMEEEQQAK